MRLEQCVIAIKKDLGDFQINISLSDDPNDHSNNPDNFKIITNTCIFNKEFTKLENKIGIWLKHPDLYGWMRTLYNSKNGVDVFNCLYLKLTEIDINILYRYFINDNLPKIYGFGKAKKDIKYDLEFIEKAREYLLNDFYLYYYCFW